MNTESNVRILTGTMVLLSLALTYFFNPWWLALAVFVGLNLVQSAFTNICAARIILAALFQRPNPHRDPPDATPTLPR
jgi:hypothetical protein